MKEMKESRRRDGREKQGKEKRTRRAMVLTCKAYIKNKQWKQNRGIEILKLWNKGMREIVS